MEDDIMAKVKQFKVGKMYKMNSICDSDCWWYYKVIKRTQLTVVVAEVRKDGTRRGDAQARFRINPKVTEMVGAECISPLGTYSMSPTLSANNIHTIK